MKCRLAIFEDVALTVPEVGADMTITNAKRIPVECGGDILTVTHAVSFNAPTLPTLFYCARCGVRYEKLPEEKNTND